jgi:hypothetical protein
MDCEQISQCFNQISKFGPTSIITACAAIIAASSAFLSYLLSRNIYQEIKSDEVIIPGPPHHPDLQTMAHRDCVLRFSLFNKSKRKAYVTSISAFDSNGKRIEITWSDKIDKLGNIIDPKGLIGIENETYFAIRRNDGEEFNQTTIRIIHSFRKDELTLSYDPLKAWVKY